MDVVCVWVSVAPSIRLTRAPWCALGLRPPRRPPSGRFYAPVPVEFAAASGSIGTVLFLFLLLARLLWVPPSVGLALQRVAPSLFASLRARGLAWLFLLLPSSCGRFLRLQEDMASRNEMLFSVARGGASRRRCEWVALAPAPEVRAWPRLRDINPPVKREGVPRSRVKG